ncbi:MAG: RND transporter, partial [Methylocystis sp.]|nr:RND transporter [Methylocystis sp.]
AEYDLAVDSYNETLLQAAQQVADSVAAVRQTKKALDAQAALQDAARKRLQLARTRLADGLRDRREIVAAAHDVVEQQFVARALEADHLSASVDLIQALGGGYADGPAPGAPRPTPEKDELTPVVDVIQSLGGG